MAVFWDRGWRESETPSKKSDLCLSRRRRIMGIRRRVKSRDLVFHCDDDDDDDDEWRVEITAATNFRS